MERGSPPAAIDPNLSLSPRTTAGETRNAPGKMGRWTY
jgi:hypothetical protein